MDASGTILVAVDFSPSAASALTQAMRIAGRTGAQVRVVHVVETLVMIDMYDALSVMQEEIVTAMRDEANKHWKAFAAQIPGAESLPFEVEINSTVAALSIRSNALKASLLAMGTRGLHEKRGVGTVAAACVRSAPTDVLLVQPEHVGAFKVIVAAVDFSDTSRRALERAVQVATWDSAELHVVHVFTAPWKKALLVSRGVPPTIEGEYRAQLSAKLSEFSRPFESALPMLGAKLQLVEGGSHGQALGQYARQVNAQLVVMGTKGRTNLREVLLGSTTERVLREDPCSILAVKPRAHQ